ncbi:hypothetical protein ACK8Q8_002753 [Proteus mirabilis]|nr:hypothetical protein [Proteus mirabilis]HEK0396307.1 hypothetical protein [Proteus mirabilis]HEK0597590.1 hypothetical protein [Proteus mirabilis]HEK1930782.1 hypothetical protein [Proteus mirabilis]HEK2975373.1 hypothetical protein [Proteus mirabilis]
MFEPTTINDVITSLFMISRIQRPDFDNDGDPINSPSVYNYLSREDQEKVDDAERITMDYVRTPGGEPNKRTITLLNKKGFSTYFNRDQYDPYRYVGTVQVGDWILDISDPSTGNKDWF